MIEKLIKAGATVLAAAMLAACGGENGPERDQLHSVGVDGRSHR